MYLIKSYIKIETILKDTNGATMVEYSLMVAFIAIVAFAAVATLGTNLNIQFVSLLRLFP